MFQRFNHRGGHYLLLVFVGAVVMLPNLGAPSLWDIDEGHNAEAAREMLVSGNWVTPTFNFQLRVDKPALLYWMQIAGYQLFGVSEFAARLPSALAAILAVLLTYELGRRMFDAGTGLLAGLVLASAGMFCAAGHFANPDALLNTCGVLTFLLFWSSFARGGQAWLVLIGFSMGLAMLTKGPVGLVLPVAVLGLFLLWSWQWRRLLDWRILWGLLAFLVVAAPWYVLVGLETHGDFLEGFFLKHNVQRFLAPMENHRGPFFYFAAALLLGFLPWSAFFGPAVWNAMREFRDGERRSEYQFLICWMAAYVAFFSFSSTKLPNYILPIYPAVALIVGRCLERWRQRTFEVPTLLLNLSWLGLILLGVGTAAGLLLAGGVITLPVQKGRFMPGLEIGAVLGAVPIMGAAAGWWWARQGRRDAALGGVVATAVVFIAALAGWGATFLDAFKAPRPLVATAGAQQTDHEVRVGCFDYYQPSLVFYCRREVNRLTSEKQALDFLRNPLPVYLFVSEAVWAQLEPRVTGSYRLLGRHPDMYRRCDVVVVTNR